MNAGCPHNGFAWPCAESVTNVGRHSGLQGRRRDLLVQCQTSSAVPTDHRVWLNHLQTPPPTGPESVQHNPQEPVAPVEAQATRRVLLENRKLVTKREDLRLQGSTGSKTGGY